MAQKRILLLDGPFLTAHYWSAGRIRVEGEFSHEPVGLEALAAYLDKHRSSLFYLLADIAEEGFQLEDLPYVQGGDRNALLQRRLVQYYYNTSLSAAISLGRAKDGRPMKKCCSPRSPGSKPSRPGSIRCALRRSLWWASIRCRWYSRDALPS